MNKEEILKDIGEIVKEHSLDLKFVDREVWGIFNDIAGPNIKGLEPIFNKGWLHFILPSKDKSMEKDICVIQADDGLKKGDFRRDYWDGLMEEYNRKKEERRQLISVMREAVVRKI